MCGCVDARLPLHFPIADSNLTALRTQNNTAPPLRIRGTHEWQPCQQARCQRCGEHDNTMRTSDFEERLLKLLRLGKPGVVPATVGMFGPLTACLALALPSLRMRPMRLKKPNPDFPLGLLAKSLVSGTGCDLNCRRCSLNGCSDAAAIPAMWPATNYDWPMQRYDLVVEQGTSRPRRLSSAAYPICARRACRKGTYLDGKLLTCPCWWSPKPAGLRWLRQ